MNHPNESILEARWPELLAALADSDEVGELRLELLGSTPHRTLRVEGIQLASAVEPAAEARLQALLIPEDAKEATIYGMGQGALPRCLLERSSLERLTVVLISKRVAVASLLELDHLDWLLDPRVELRLPGLLDELEVPFAACPADLRLADGDGLRPRDLARMELALPHVRKGLAAREEEFATNLCENEALLATDPDVGELHGAAAGATIRVCAAGPTLSDHFERLRDSNGPLIAVDAALKPLLEAGIVPDVVVSLDSLPHGMRAIFDVPTDRLRNTKLVYFPVVPNEVLVAWPGPRLLATTASGPYAALAAQRPGAVLWSSGCVLHPAVDLAVRMGAARIELYGADFANPRGKTHVDGCAWQWDVQEEGTKPWVTDGHGGRVTSQDNLIGYLRELERYVGAQREVEFVNAGRDGARILGVRYDESLDHAA